jgi:hypothetical protein
MRTDPTKEELAAIAAKIETVLQAFGWTLDRSLNEEPDRWNVCRRAADSFGAMVWGSWGREDSTGKRIAFSLSLPESQNGNHYGIEKPSITVSADKTAEQIIADVRRRFLPGMALAVQEAVRRNMNQKMARDRRVVALEQSTGVKFDGLSQWGKDHYTVSVTLYPEDYDEPGKITADVKTDSDGRADLDLGNLPPILCAAVLDLVRKYTQEQAELSRVSNPKLRADVEALQSELSRRSKP